MAWEMELFKRTRLASYPNCLSLLDAYSNFAPLWERTLLAVYVGLGPPLARIFGGKTKTLWHQAEVIVGDLLSVSKLSPEEVVGSLRYYVKLSRSAKHNFTYAEACDRIYERSFYPLVTHFTFAFQSSAVARLRFVKRIAATMAAETATVADLGCGSGVMLCEVLKANDRWTGYGLDISGTSVDYARRLAQHHGLNRRAVFQQGSITQLPFATRSLDLVIASEVLEHLPEPEAAFREIARVLAPTGILALTVPIESHNPAHVNSVGDPIEFSRLCTRVGLRVKSLASKWHVTFGDDRRHLFALAQLQDAVETFSPAHSLSWAQISSAASNGMVSS